jgi:hypothetical protein
VSQPAPRSARLAGGCQVIVDPAFNIKCALTWPEMRSDASSWDAIFMAEGVTFIRSPIKQACAGRRRRPWTGPASQTAHSRHTATLAPAEARTIDPANVLMP